MLKALPQKLHYLTLMTRYRSIMSLLWQLKKHFYGEYCYVGLEKNLAADDLPEIPTLDYSLVLASDEDMEKIVQKARMESKKSAVELIRRKLFYDSGFKRCYIAKIKDSNDISAMMWLILPIDASVNSHFYKRLFPNLDDTDSLVEMAYTFEKYRGYGLDPSVTLKIAAIAKSQGARRLIAYVLRDNITSIRCCEKIGFQKFEMRYQRKFLFMSKISLKKYMSIIDVALTANSNARDKNFITDIKGAQN
jgi:hypothetical protein